MKGGYRMNPSLSLETIRKTEGIKRLEKHVKTLIQHDKKSAAAHLNDESLTYSTLYILSSTIRENGLNKYLSDRNKVALAIQQDILAKERTPSAPFPYSICDLPQFVQSVLRWMVETGSADQLNARYRLVIDRSAGLLTTIYQDPTDIPLVSELLFKRNDDHHSTHYLTCAYFSSRNFSSLLPIGEKLQSPSQKQVAFASELLHFISGLEDSTDRYAYFRAWYEENLPYLCPNENNYEMTAELSPYVVDHYAKYKEQRTTQSSERHEDLTFQTLSENLKVNLADFSYKLRRNSREEWKEWMRQPLDAQIRLIEEVQDDHYRR